jgi:SAM-dependent methyltransferase
MAPDISGKKILDYGCGKGDLYQHIMESSIDVDYSGWDITPDLIALAKDKHPNAHFEVASAEESRPDDRFDLVFVCGVFNNRVQGVHESMLNTLEALFEITDEALLINALSSHSRDKAVELHYASPEELSFFVSENLTPHYELRQDYLPGDFTMCVHKRPPKGSEA